ncbi:MAG TPA: hypothetical protein VGN07_00360 [Steroidobacteraceae bacterium]|jgi:uncharacterized membrane protein YagU involved in acid resistance
MLKPITVATGIAGTLDLLSAFVFAGLAGMGPVQVLQFVASGPLGDTALAGSGYAVAGVLVHFAIMACMVAAYMIVAQRVPVLVRRPLIAGIVYGLLLWFIMYWVVRPLRWASLPHPTNPKAIANQLFSHLVLVGIPIALVAARYLRPQKTGTTQHASMGA